MTRTWLCLALGLAALLPAPTAQAQAPRPPREKLQALGMGFHTTMFATEERYGYTLMGPSITYQYFVGRRWGFALRGELYFPLAGRYAGPERDFRTGLRSPYEAKRIGLDGILGVARRIRVSADLGVMLGFGVHVQSFKLSGTQYAPIEGITAGVGGFGRLDWQVHRVVSLGAEAAFGVDPLDLVRHRNRAILTFPVSIALSLAFRYGPGETP